MITEQQILNKIQELKSYCIANGESTGDYAGFISTLSQAVVNYFHGSTDDLENQVVTVIGALYNDLSRRSIVYENPIGKPSPTNYPKGYKDFTEIFDGDGVFVEILAMDKATFLNGFPISTVAPVAEGEGSSIIVEINPIIPVWISKLNTAHEVELAQIETIVNFCNKGASQNMIFMLFEDMGPSRRIKKVSDIANEIYIDMGIKEVIEVFNLDIHIPTYIG